MYQINQSKCKPYACRVKEFQRKPYCPPPTPYSRKLTVSYLSHSNRVNVSVYPPLWKMAWKRGIYG